MKCPACARADVLVSKVHDAIYAEVFDQKAASDAVWAVHEVLRATAPDCDCGGDLGHDSRCAYQRFLDKRHATRAGSASGSQRSHEETKDCWCHPVVETYPNGDLVIHRAGRN